MSEWLGRILAYVDSPFKLFAVMLMAVVGFAGFLVYKNHDVLIGAYREQQRLPNLNEARLDDAVAHLMRYTQAQVVTIFKVNPILGTRVLYRAHTRDGRAKDREGIDVGLFSASSSNNRDVVALMAGEIPCGEYRTAQSEVGLWYLEQGMRFGCRISVPPEAGRFIGQITVGWAEPPQDLENTKAMLMIAANMLSRPRH